MPGSFVDEIKVRQPVKKYYPGKEIICDLLAELEQLFQKKRKKRQADKFLKESGSPRFQFYKQ